MRCSKMYTYHKHLKDMENQFDIQEIIKLRHELHQTPELSDFEFITAERIAQFLSQFKNAKLIRGIGGNGIACVFEGKEEGPTVLFRCDMDALPIIETNDFEYTSKEKGVSHKCGHDGHMAIMVGFAGFLAKNPPEKGQVILLFQPAEETGQGASRVLNDDRFKNLKIDYVFALHNLPGFSKGNIILRNDTFASASKGMIIRLTGKTSHAAEPENGISPALAMADIIKKMVDLPKKTELFDDLTLVTIIHAKLGEVAFGTSPGEAVIMATLRSHQNTDMEKLTLSAESLVKQISSQYKLESTIEYAEEFPATINNKELVKLIEDSANNISLKTIYLEKPFRWSEDFAHFTQQYSGALFGLGSGENCAQLHNPDYDFPDEIIENGIKIFYEIYQQII